MNKYSLIIEEHNERIKDFHTKPIITIEGSSITELLAKLPLEINVIHEVHIHNIKRKSDLDDDDIPF